MIFGWYWGGEGGVDDIGRTRRFAGGSWRWAAVRGASCMVRNCGPREHRTGRARCGRHDTRVQMRAGRIYAGTAPGGRPCGLGPAREPDPALSNKSPTLPRRGPDAALARAPRTKIRSVRARGCSHWHWFEACQRGRHRGAPAIRPPALVPSHACDGCVSNAHHDVDTASRSAARSNTRSDALPGDLFHRRAHVQA